LYREELRAMMRGRFAWLGAGVVLLALGGVAAALRMRVRASRSRLRAYL